MNKKLTHSPRDVDVSWALFCIPHHTTLDPSPVPSVLLLSSLSPSSCAAAVFVVSCRCLFPSLSPSLLSTYGGCPPPRLSSSPGPCHRCCCCHLSSCCRCQCHPVPLFLSSWLPFFFVVLSSPSLLCQLFPPREQLLAVMGCWWPLVSLPHHSLSLPHSPCHQTSPRFVVVLIQNLPHKQVLVAMESLWVCHLGAVWW